MAFLSGCAFEKMQQALPYLEGKPIDAAVRYLGVPDGQIELKHGLVYVWNRRESGTYLIPVTSVTTYPVYRAGVLNHSTAYATSHVPQSYVYSCSIKAFTNTKKIIEAFDYEGSEGGCEGFIDAMDSIVEDFGPRSVAAKDDRPKAPL